MKVSEGVSYMMIVFKNLVRSYILWSGLTSSNNLFQMLHSYSVRLSNCGLLLSYGLLLGIQFVASYSGLRRNFLGRCVLLFVFLY